MELEEVKVKVPVAHMEQAVLFYSVVFAAEEVHRLPVRVELKVRETTLLVCAQADDNGPTVSKDDATASRNVFQLHIHDVNIAASLASTYGVKFQVTKDSCGLHATLTDPFGFNWVLKSDLPSHPLPPYSEMILSAIRALDNKKSKKGCKMAAISNHIKKHQMELPPLHPVLVTAGLRGMCEAKILERKKDAYFLVNNMEEGPSAPLSTIPSSLPCRSGPKDKARNFSSGAPEISATCGPEPKKAKVSCEAPVSAASPIAVEKSATD